MRAVRERFPKASKKLITRAAMHRVIINAAVDPLRSEGEAFRFLVYVVLGVAVVVFAVLLLRAL